MVASGLSRWELPSNRMAVNLAVLRVRDYLNRESPHDARTCGISGSRKYALASPGERPGQDLTDPCARYQFATYRPPTVISTIGRSKASWSSWKARTVRTRA